MAALQDHTALLSGFYWYPGAPAARGVVLTYSFSSGASDYYLVENPAAAASFQPFSDSARDMAREALRQWGDASGITFIETTQHKGDITFGYYDLSLLGYPAASGLGSYPQPGAFIDNTGAPKVYSTDPSAGGDIKLSVGYTFGTLPFDDQLPVLLHEVGHALGLRHPHDGPDTLDPSLDTRVLTAMSYNGPRTVNLGLFDYEAIQAIYGTDTGANNPAVWSWDPASETLTSKITGDRQYFRDTGAIDIVWSTGAECAIVTTAGDDIVIAEGDRTEINVGGGNDSVAVLGSVGK